MFDGPGSAVDWPTAGLSVFTVQAAGPEPISPFSIARDDANVALNQVALGTWSVSLSATNTAGERWSGTEEGVVVTGEGVLATVVLQCVAADGVNGCEASAE